MQQLQEEISRVEIRPMRITDLNQVMAIEPIAFGVHHWSWQSFEKELDNRTGLYYAALDADLDVLVGYSGFWLIGEEAHITTLAVHPKFRRQYIGERLLINDILQARRAGARWMTLEVRMSNRRAQNLYHKYGFKNLGKRKHYYQDNDEDALVLWTESIESPQFTEFLDERYAALFPLARSNADLRLVVNSERSYAINEWSECRGETHSHP